MAMMISSKRGNALLSMFSCPLVIGSKEPGKMAMRFIGYVLIIANLYEFTKYYLCGQAGDNLIKQEYFQKSRNSHCRISGARRSTSALKGRYWDHARSPAIP